MLEKRIGPENRLLFKDQITWVLNSDLLKEAAISFVIVALMFAYDRFKAKRRAVPATAPATQPLLKALAQIPIPVITLFGSTLAAAFNLGFFLSVGVIFMSLFSIQEHIVFAISGFVEVTLFLAAISIVFQAVRNVEDGTFGNLIVAALIFVGLIFPINWAWGLIRDTYLDAGLDTAISVGLIICSAAAFVVALRFRPRLGLHETNEKTIAVLAAISIFTATSIGIYRGNELVHSVKQSKANWAVTRSGTRLGIVRIGADYSLLVDATTVVTAYRTGDLLQISSEKITPAPTQGEGKSP
jgi:hypothetical protein